MRHLQDMEPLPLRDLRYVDDSGDSQLQQDSFLLGPWPLYCTERAVAALGTSQVLDFSTGFPEEVPS
jgi:hypothetical protein